MHRPLLQLLLSRHATRENKEKKSAVTLTWPSTLFGTHNIFIFLWFVSPSFFLYLNSFLSFFFVFFFYFFSFPHRYLSLVLICKGRHCRRNNDNGIDTIVQSLITIETSIFKFNECNQIHIWIKIIIIVQCALERG